MTALQSQKQKGYTQEDFKKSNLELTPFKKYLKNHPTKLNKFIGLILGFNKEISKVIELEVSKAQYQEDRKQKNEKLKLQQEFNKKIETWIELQEEEKILMLLKRGHELTSKQMNIIYEKDIFKDTEIQSYVKLYLQNVYKNQLAEQMTIADYNDVYSEDDYEDDGYDALHYDTHVMDDLKEYKKFQHRDIINLYQKNKKLWTYLDFNEEIKDEEFALYFLNGAKVMYSLVESEKSAPLSEIKVFFAEVIEKIKTMHQVVIEESFLKEIDKYEVLLNDFESLKTLIAKDSTENIKNFQETQIPRESRDLIKEIHATFKGLQEYQLNHEHKLEVDNLYSKRFPQVMEEYILIPASYKEKVKDMEKSPENLLLDSLKQIHSHMSTILNDYHENIHNEMKVTNSYLKKLENVNLMSTQLEKEVQSQVEFKNNDTKNTSRFKKFLEFIFDFFKSEDIEPLAKKEQVYIKKLKEKEKSKLKEELNSKVNELIQNAQIDRLAILIEKGFQPEPSQLFKILILDEKFSLPDIIKNKLSQFMDDEFYQIFYNDLKKVKVKKNPVYSTSLLDTSADQITLLCNDNEYIKLQTSMLTMYETQEMLEDLMTALVKVWHYDRLDMSIRNDTSKAIEAYEVMIHLKQELTLDTPSGEYGPIKRSVNEKKVIQLINNYIPLIEGKYDDLIQGKRQDEFDKYDVLFDNFENIKKQAVHDIRENVKNFKEEDLPKESRILLKEVNDLLKSIEIVQLNQEDKIVIQILKEKRIPQLLEEYMIIPKSYKEKFNQKPEGPDELLKSSLEEIKEKLTTLGNNFHEDNHQKLKATANYLKKI